MPQKFSNLVREKIEFGQGKVSEKSGNFVAD